LLSALALNGVFVWQAIAIQRNPSNGNIWRLYRYSLLYLALLFLAMGVDGLFYRGTGLFGDFVLRLPF
jgi:protoheme IX farnesyltransferase